MEGQEPTPVLFVVLTLFSVGSLLIWKWAGWFSYRDVPLRKPPGALAPTDVFIGLAFYLLGGLLAGQVIGPFIPAGEKLSKQPVGPLVLGFQLLSVLPFMAYFAWRTQPGARPPAAEDKPSAGLLRLTAIGVGVGLTVLPVMLLTNTLLVEIAFYGWSIQRPEGGHAYLTQLAQDPTPVRFLFVFLSAVIVAPVAEEILFRGVFCGALRPLGRPVAIGFSAVVFSLVHFSAVPWQVLPALGLLGLFLGLLYERTGSLWPCIVAHLVFNAMNLLLMMLVIFGPK
jgi:membrane protease YdiL (CAAX protease family)